MKKQEATNTFQEGMIMDLNPIVTPNSVLTQCLNGTLITYNGNENVLQNDMGNGRVETAYLPEGYVPLGTAELGGIIYIVSYNPLIDKCLIGSFPSPERNITSDEIQTPKIKVNNAKFQDSQGRILNTIVKVKLLLDPNSEDGLFKLNPGDKYTIYSTNKGITQNQLVISDVNTGIYKVDANPRHVTIHVVSIGEDGKITYLDDSLKWDSDLNYYIKEAESREGIKQDIDEYRSLVSSAYNVFNSKVSGELALLFELKVIDSFSVTWDANVQDSDDKKKASITFNLGWTSSDSLINPKYAKLTKSQTSSEISTEVLENNICELDLSSRREDGSLEVTVGDFEYEPGGDLSNYTWNYQVTPAMNFGELPYLAIDGTINFAEIGSGKIDVDEWRYYVAKNSLSLNWGMAAYPEKNKRINRVILTFIEFDKVSTTTVKKDNTAYSTTIYPQYVISGKNSYSGNFLEVINFGKSSRVSNGGIAKDSLYLVDICAEYGSGSSWEYRHNYKWLYTTEQWNKEFEKGTETDFTQNLTLTDSIGFKTVFEQEDKITTAERKTSLSIPDVVNNDAYDVMGAKMLSVNYNATSKTFDKTKESASIKISVSPRKYDDLFDLVLTGNDQFTNRITNKYIVYSKQQVDAEQISAISDAVLSKKMDPREGALSATAEDNLKAVLLADSITQALDAKAVDAFDAKILGASNTSTISLNIFGAMFSRINADLTPANITIGLRIRPLLYSTDDYPGLGIKSATLYLLEKYFQEGHKDLGGGKPFSFKFRQLTWSGTLEASEYSKKSYWDPSDKFTRTTYWDDTKPYTEWLNNWMHGVGGPFQIVEMGKAPDYNNSITGYGRDLKGCFIIWARTNNGHFVPIKAYKSGTNAKKQLAEAIVKFLMQVYYVETDVTPEDGKIVKSINRLASYDESWNIDVSSTLTVLNMNNSLKLKSSSGVSKSLGDLQTICTSIKNNGGPDIPVKNISHSGGSLDLGSSTFTHIFRVNSNDIYIDYENAKSASIPAIYEICSKADRIIGPVKNANSLYVYNNNKTGHEGLMVLNEKNSIYINYNGTVSEGTNGRLLLNNASYQSAKTKLCNMLILRDGELYIDEDKLLSLKSDFYYNTGDEGATYKSNSEIPFITIPSS